MGDYIVSAMAGGSDSFMDNLDANSLFLVQCVIAGTIGGLEFCFPALFVDTFNTFEVYTSHRLYGATMIVNAIIVYTMRETKDHKIKREKRKITTGYSTMQRAQKAEEDLKKSNEALVKQTRMLKEANAKIAKLEASDSKK